MCKSCRTAWTIDERHCDRDTLQQGQINEVRTQDQILTSMWAHEKVKGQNCPWIQGRPETMCTHLKNCQRQPEDRERPDPLRMYEGIRFQNRPLSPLQMLAQRIFSICANFASCERLFSLFGLILTKLRSRLALEKMLDLAELRLHLRDEYMWRGSAKDREGEADD
ncbi:hypothetical protein K503DRAFT_823873 [Rhizopogon vinicolor AM-OR11-026]|uniref:HAT C-terminal dimerisation domain-containing protein n=1 Tax=Rhizopogon vinicolor AM-OR11-026 TaxID=1314800 RepID=A0A1B7NDH9_9AGAM|nr:hypothetical protein K503DRAFT_823873 [Rhizopogon vinicolor AM-OR11-026]